LISEKALMSGANPDHSLFFFGCLHREEKQEHG
jgi:hypothetical protein